MKWTITLEYILKTFKLLREIKLNYTDVIHRSLMVTDGLSHSLSKLLFHFENVSYHTWVLNAVKLFIHWWAENLSTLILSSFLSPYPLIVKVFLLFSFPQVYVWVGPVMFVSPFCFGKVDLCWNLHAKARSILHVTIKMYVAI